MKADLSFFWLTNHYHLNSVWSGY